MKKYRVLLFLGLLVLSLGACSNRKINQKPYEEKQFLMGTYVQIRIYDANKQKVLKSAFTRIKELADKISVNVDDSEMAAVNAAAGIKPVKVSPDSYYLLKKAVDYSQASKGNFDLTIGAITALWRIGFPDAHKPVQKEIDQALEQVDYRHVVFNDQDQTVYLQEKGMKLDLGAIAKGYITDEVVKLLKKQQVTTAIINLGGNIFVLGHDPEGKNWQVGIQDPKQSQNSILGTVPVTNCSVVTSGVYERYLEVEDKQYHHLFDPQTGYPLNNELTGVTILSPKSLDGDGLSTAVFAMGTKQGLAYVEGLKDTEAVFVTKKNEIYLTSGLKDKFQLDEQAGYRVGKLQEFD